jgi:site-specific DNA-methyltransferase (adenine-specific)
MGSGQTALAALKSGRNFVGYELNKQYLNLAKKRIDERV